MEVKKLQVAEWIKAMPKIELHAHLSGSVPADTLRHLLNLPKNEHVRWSAKGLLDASSGRTLRQCFELFGVIHALIQDCTTLHTVVLEVLDSFQSDNVVYLELRTTPRATTRMSIDDYLRTVLGAIDAHTRAGGTIVCRVIVSLSRHLPVSDAKHVMAVLSKLMKHDAQEEQDVARRLIVGVELSGDPRKGDWKEFQPMLRDVRQALKLPVSLHFAEISNDKEALQMLEFNPDRVGHAAVMSKKVVQRLLDMRPRIGVEVCITSNLVTKSVNIVREHPVVTHLIPHRHPFCLCTDDSGVFDTSLSEEYALLVNATGLSEEQVKGFARNSLEMAFCRDQQVMRNLRNLF